MKRTAFARPNDYALSIPLEKYKEYSSVNYCVNCCHHSYVKIITCAEAAAVVAEQCY